VNVALDGPGATRWTMTERGRRALTREAGSLRIGPSSAVWRDGRLICDLDEVTAPLPARVHGRIVVTPGKAGAPAPCALDAAGRHLWWPVAPRARIEVVFDRPALRWQGKAYLDGNFGDRPPAHDFAGWQWSRSRMDAETAIFYDLETVQGARRGLAMGFADDGTLRDLTPPPFARLPRGLWGIEGAVRCDAASTPRLDKRLVDAPFYTRSRLGTELAGERAVTIHESLSLSRLEQSWVRALLPFRMPRRG